MDVRKKISLGVGDLIITFAEVFFVPSSTAAGAVSPGKSLKTEETLV